MSDPLLTEATLAARLRDRPCPSLEEIGGVSTLKAVGVSQVRSLYADRMVAAIAALPSPGEELSGLLLDVLAQNPNPFTIAASAQHASHSALSATLVREAQRCLIARWSTRASARDAEVATECLAGAFLFSCHAGASRPAFVAALDDVRPAEDPLVVARAALLAGLAWQWRRSEDLCDILRRLADDPEAGGQALYELALIRLDEALGASDADTLLAGLEAAAAAFRTAQVHDPELEEARAFEAGLRAVLGFCRNAPPDQVELQIQRAREHASERQMVLGHSSVRHWLRPRLDAEMAWAALAQRLEGLTERLEQRSWLNAVPVLQQLAHLRRASTLLATGEGDRLRIALDDRLAASFLGAEGLRAQLSQWAGDRSTAEADRVEALALLAHLDAMPAAPPGKGQGLAALPTGASPNKVGTADERLAAIRILGLAASFTAKTEEIFAALDQALASSPDYRDEFRGDCRMLNQLLLQFLTHCLDVAPAMATGLFDFLFDLTSDPLEKELQRALFTVLRLQTFGFPQHQINREVPDIAAGRADIAIIRPAWRIVIEIKRELGDASRAGIAQYLGQAASYTQTGPRISFLVVLDLCSQRSWPASIEDNVWVESVRGDSDSVPRHVVVWRVPGRRPAPSSIKTPTPSPPV